MNDGPMCEKNGPALRQICAGLFAELICDIRASVKSLCSVIRSGTAMQPTQNVILSNLACVKLCDHAYIYSI